MGNHVGRLAQLARASRLHREGQGFESLSAHQKKEPPNGGFLFGNESFAFAIGCQNEQRHVADTDGAMSSEDVEIVHSASDFEQIASKIELRHER